MGISGKEECPTYIFSWKNIWRHFTGNMFKWFHLLLWLDWMQIDLPHWCQRESKCFDQLTSSSTFSSFSVFDFILLMCQNLYWADSGDLVTIASDTSFYILKYNVRILENFIPFFK